MTAASDQSGECDFPVHNGVRCAVLRHWGAEWRWGAKINIILFSQSHTLIIQSGIDTNVFEVHCETENVKSSECNGGELKKKVGLWWDRATWADLPWKGWGKDSEVHVQMKNICSPERHQQEVKEKLPNRIKIRAEYFSVLPEISTVSMVALPLSCAACFMKWKVAVIFPLPILSLLNIQIVPSLLLQSSTAAEASKEFPVSERESVCYAEWQRMRWGVDSGTEHCVWWWQWDKRCNFLTWESFSSISDTFLPIFHLAELEDGINNAIILE